MLQGFLAILALVGVVLIFLFVLEPLATYGSKRFRAWKSIRHLKIDREIPVDMGEYEALCELNRLNALRGNKTLLRLKELEHSPEADRITRISAILDVCEASAADVLEAPCEWSNHELLRQAEELEKQGPVPPKLRARRLLLLGTHYGSKRLYALALLNYKKVLSILEKNNDTASRNYYKACLAAGVLYFRYERYSRALPLLRRAYYSYCRARVLDTAAAGLCLEHIGLAHVISGRYDDGISFLEEAYQLFELRGREAPEVLKHLPFLEARIRAARESKRKAEKRRQLLATVIARFSFS